MAGPMLGKCFHGEVQPQSCRRLRALNVNKIPQIELGKRCWAVVTVHRLGPALLGAHGDGAEELLGSGELLREILGAERYQAHLVWAIVPLEIEFESIHRILALGHRLRVERVQVSGVKPAHGIIRACERIHCLNDAAAVRLDVLGVFAVDGMHLLFHETSVEQRLPEEVREAVHGLGPHRAGDLAEIDRQVEGGVSIVAAPILAHEIIESARLWVLLGA
mmetsp:Transcript_100248/g.283751  ORF Transcript_100248/g.283751 Transcript_100248/m.283751 type:complete len:220 (+) Transcript_100248:2315-2974(+)